MPTYQSDYVRGRGAVTTAHSAITATTTSTAIDLTGYTGALVECAVTAITSGNWVCELTGNLTNVGTFGSIFQFDGATSQATNKPLTAALNANGVYVYYFTGLPAFVKVVATRTTDGTLTCRVQPIR